MKNPTTEILEAASDMIAGGAKWKEVLQIEWPVENPEDGTKLTYSQIWLFHYRRNLDPALDLAHLSPATKEGQAAIAEARAENQSWGFIAVRFNRPEAQIRKQYTEKTGLKSQGSRIGRGGRWFDRDAVLYAEDRKPTGVAIPKDCPRAQVREVTVLADHATYLESLPTDELKRRCRLLGLKDTSSRKVLVARLDEATR